jgi:GlpG protein
MRKIGELPGEHEAQLFHDALFVHGIENDIESEGGGAFSIWIHDDDQREKASALLEKFRKSPEAADWQDANKAGKLRKQQQRENARRASHIITRERLEYERNIGGFSTIPFALAILSVLATILAGELEMQLLPSSWADREYRRNEVFYITRNGPPAAEQARIELLRQRYEDGVATVAEMNEFAQRVGKAGARRYDRSLPEIRSGQVWRLFTPMLLHFGFLHLIFNIMWLRDLGSILQLRFGAGYFVAFVLSSAAVSNLAQLAWAGPNFGGLSGVNYALFGFLWLRGKYDRTGVWRLNPVIIQTMLLWFVICLTGILGPIANTAHAVGLAFGAACGFLTAKLASTRRR